MITNRDGAGVLVDHWRADFGRRDDGARNRDASRSGHCYGSDSGESKDCKEVGELHIEWWKWLNCVFEMCLLLE